MKKLKIVVLTGAGMSADSGLKTFRDSNGLWEGHDVMEVASIQGWYSNSEKVLEFYNLRRKQAWVAEPNKGHLALKELEDYFDVHIITQNVDGLHEKAGSRNVLHLHGQLRFVRSENFPDLVYDYEDRPIYLGDNCELGSQLRPDIVWFGEPVPAIQDAIGIVKKADIFAIIGTSLVVYPAAGLLEYVRTHVPVYLVDPQIPNIRMGPNFTHLKETAAIGTPKLLKTLIEKHT